MKQYLYVLRLLSWFPFKKKPKDVPKARIGGDKTRSIRNIKSPKYSELADITHLYCIDRFSRFKFHSKEVFV